jgi:hypothetical protein
MDAVLHRSLCVTRAAGGGGGAQGPQSLQIRCDNAGGWLTQSPSTCIRVIMDPAPWDTAEQVPPLPPPPPKPQGSARPTHPRVMQYVPLEALRNPNGFLRVPLYVPSRTFRHAPLARRGPRYYGVTRLAATVTPRICCSGTLPDG